MIFKPKPVQVRLDLGEGKREIEKERERTSERTSERSLDRVTCLEKGITWSKWVHVCACVFFEHMRISQMEWNYNSLGVESGREWNWNWKWKRSNSVGAKPTQRSMETENQS